MNIELTDLATLAGQQAPGLFLSAHSAGNTGKRHCAWFGMTLGLNSGLFACTASHLPTETSSWPHSAVNGASGVLKAGYSRPLPRVTSRNKLFSCTSLGSWGNGLQGERVLSESRELPEFAVNLGVGKEAAYPFFSVSPKTDTHALSLSLHTLPLPAA